jgi:ATPase subunit of ABC transporter with duplicated ATPase domains
MIAINGLTKHYGDRTLFEDVSLQLNAGERYGLVGANGSGKTTFLNIVTGAEEASSGTVSIPKRLRLGVLRQDQFLYENEQILNVTLMGNPELWDAMVERDKLLANAHEEFDADKYSELEDTILRHDGYTAEARAAEILEGLGLPAVIHRSPLSTLSGGFKLRVLLAQVLASNPDVLLLDEPTNHLDILSIRWLEGFIREFSGPVVVISHDHKFLDGVATHILDVDYQDVIMYRGNYSAFVELKKAERERKEKDIAGQQSQIDAQMEFVARFKAKASKARQAQSKLKMVERAMEEMEELPVSSRRWPTFRIQEHRHSGRDVLKIKGVKKSYGEKQVLHGVDLTVQRGDRLAIMGPNGIGKSTLLKIAMGVVDADEGEAEWGYETHVGYFAQDHHEDLDKLDQTAEEWVSQFCPDKGVGFVRGHMAMMLFTGDDPKKKLSALSGGEAARLVFTKIAIERPNVLVLDEPTNHLDLESIEALVEGLQAYTGTLILVSHDRWFIEQLATRIVDIEPAGITDYQGTYDEYVAFAGMDHLDTERVLLAAKQAKGGQVKGGNSPKRSSASSAK